MNGKQIFEPVDFREVFAGDRIQFDSDGFDNRAGTVIRANAKAVAIRCEDGSLAVLRRADWNRHSPQRAVTTTTAKRAIYVRAGDQITIHGVRQLVRLVETPYFRTVCIHTDITDAKDFEPWALESTQEVEVHQL